MMTRALRTIGVTLAMLLALGVLTTQAQTQFGGTWVLDATQSQLPKHRGRGHEALGTPPEIRLLVDQQATTLRATRTMTRGNVERSMSVTYATDGSEVAFQGRRGTSVTRALFDGARLVVTTTHARPGDHGDRTSTRESIWTLSPDGRTLTIDTTFQSPRGTRTFKTVYLRG